MAEIKLNDGFQAEVDAFRNTGVDLDSVSAGSLFIGGYALPTVEAYVGRASKIHTLVMNIQLLIEKDAKDMVALAEKLKAADGSAGGGSGGGGGGSW